MGWLKIVITIWLSVLCILTAGVVENQIEDQPCSSFKPSESPCGLRSAATQGVQYKRPGNPLTRNDYYPKECSSSLPHCTKWFGKNHTAEDEDRTTESSKDEEPVQCFYGTAKNPIPKLKKTNEDLRVATLKCEEYTWKLKYELIETKKNEIECAILTATSEVVGGSNSRQGEFPHMGGVGWKTNNSYTFACGTTLLSNRYSLTAGHCRSTTEEQKKALSLLSIYPEIVKFGHVNIHTTVQATIVKIAKFLTLPEFDADPIKKYNDIALIRFDRDIDFKTTLHPACLWYKPMDSLTTGNVTGWGLTDPSKYTSPEILQYAQVDIYKSDTCIDKLKNKYYRHWNHLNETQFCAGKQDSKVDTCSGDSGGPLEVSSPYWNDTAITVHYVVGVTSFGFECSTAFPGIYTKVNEYLCWIEKNVWPDESNPRC